jgi:hypothetical protein
MRQLRVHDLLIRLFLLFARVVGWFKPGRGLFCFWPSPVKAALRLVGRRRRAPSQIGFDGRLGRWA